MNKEELLKHAVEVEDLEQVADALTGAELHEGGLRMRSATGLSTKTVHEEDDLKTMVEARGMPWDDGYTTRQAQWWASDERPDSDGDIVIQNWDFSRFETNSPLAFSHNWWSIALGRAVHWDVETREDKEYSGDALKLTGVFAVDTDPFIDSVNRLVQARIMVAGSVGFEIGDIKYIKEDEIAEELGARWILANNLLLEYSVTLLGANPGSVVAERFKGAARKGLVQPSDVNALREMSRKLMDRGKGDVDSWAAIEYSYLAMAKQVFPDTNFSLHTELDTPVELNELEDPFRKFKDELAEMKAILADIRDGLETNPAPKAFNHKAWLESVGAIS